MKINKWSLRGGLLHGYKIKVVTRGNKTFYGAIYN